MRYYFMWSDPIGRSLTYVIVIFSLLIALTTYTHYIAYNELINPSLFFIPIIGIVLFGLTAVSNESFIRYQWYGLTTAYVPKYELDYIKAGKYWVVVRTNPMTQNTKHTKINFTSEIAIRWFLGMELLVRE